MKTESVTCDGCGQDLTKTGNSVDWRLALLNQRIPSGGGCVTDMWIEPALKQDAYFCGVGCLKKWLAPPTPPDSSP